MLINGIELNALGVQLFDRVLYSNDINTSQEWLDGDIQPTFIRQQDRFKTIKLEFLVLGNNEDEAFLRISKLTAMLKKATIKFDDLNFSFDVSIIEAGEPVRLKNGNFVVPYTLSSGYAKGQREVYTTNANMTNSFKLTVMYYKNSNILLDTITIPIRASMFDKTNISLADLGIDVDKYLPTYYNSGIATNLIGVDLTYENLQKLQILIINYTPMSYKITVQYYLETSDGMYNQFIEDEINFTQPQLDNVQTIGQLLNINTYRPAGYKTRINYDKPLNLDNLLASSPINVFYDQVEVERTKNVMVSYKKENDDGEYETFDTIYLNVNETSIYDGTILSDIININGYRPSVQHYNAGYIEDHTANELITYDNLNVSYSVIYTKAENTLYIEYYAGVYPNWYRLTTTTLPVKYKSSYENEFNVLTDINIDLDKYHTATYLNGALYNQSIYNTYEDVLNAGVLQVYYTPIDYPIDVYYYTKGLDSQPIVEQVNINALMFFGNPILNDILPINKHKPEGYQFDEDFSYNGELSLEALTKAQPISIVYKEIVAARTKNIIVRYKQELSSAYSTLATTLITVSEADVAGGTRLRDIFNLNAYQPEYYDEGIVDGASSTAVIKYDDIGSEYSVLYVAKTYTTPVRYYLDEVSDTNWIGSSVISYRVIDFVTTTSLYDLGLSLNAYKPPYASDGELLYTGPINFGALLETESVNVLYKTQVAPDDPDSINYPHRFLFLQHNDLDDYEYLHPEWTMNHAFINTGISVDDMSKLTVVMECARVDDNVPLYQVNAGKAYLFGSTSPFGSYYMRFNNQTLYGEGLTGINLFEARAGLNSNILSLAESAAIGFSNSSGIYSSAQSGYSRAVFTYSHNLPTEQAQMPYPLYLFALNNGGVYADGLAGIGIYSCRIYYNDQLVRDFIPVQFYDKIGDKVAPSNCLYDKITETFFEDGSGQNSFNIKDDDRYIDTDLSHKIGFCYINYYKGEDLIKTGAVYFRGDDFSEDKENNKFDLYDRFLVDANQPQYCRPGEIVDKTSIDVSFNGLNGKTFSVYYEPIEAVITVNYYQKTEDGMEYLLKSEEVSLVEADFYQAPTFGDLVRINKYKPEGYETNFVYPGSKVSLSRVVENAPYNIIYTKMTEAPTYYTTTVRYMKQIFGVRNYETIEEQQIVLDQSDFRDGEYIDFWIEKNKYKPEKYYKDGETYQWYEMDERLNSPEDLKKSYSIVYYADPQTIDINYYTDEAHEDNLVASATWEISIDDLEPGYTYSVAEILPNNYINKFKPVNCSGGEVQGADVPHTFESLVELGYIDIVYETLVEPDDPTEAYYENKILYFGGFTTGCPTDGYGPTRSATLQNGGIIPYIDLGYKPKEVGRLKVEVKAVAQANGLLGNPVTYGFQDTSYASFFGYNVPRDHRLLGDVEGKYSHLVAGPEEDLGDFYSVHIDNQTKGHFSFSTHIPEASGWSYQSEGPQYLDGQLFYAASSGVGGIAGSPKWKYYGTNATYRRGMESIYDENWEVINCYKKYGVEEKREIGKWPINPERYYDEEIHALANPVTTIIDAYNGYWTSFTEEDSNHAKFEFYNDEDLDIFEARLQPKGSLSLFRSTNPLTGKVNIMAFYPTTRQFTGGIGTPLGLKGGNPYTGGYKSIEIEVMVRDIVDAGSDPTDKGDHSTVTDFVTKKISKTLAYGQFPLPVYPQLEACAVWGLKIWDRDRLVRDLIPVAKGDKIYDYIMPENGLFDLVTEIFFGNSNEGGEYEMTTYFDNPNASDITDNDTPQLQLATRKKVIEPHQVLPLEVMLDPAVYGKITMNYYDYDYSFIGNKFITVPTWYSPSNTTFEEIVGFNDLKPSEYYLDGLLDLDVEDKPHEPVKITLKELYDMGSANVWYKLKTFTKTVVYYRDNYRVGSKDIFYSIEDIENANSLNDLNIDLDLYWTEDFKHGKLIFDEDIIANNDITAFIDAPSPIVVYDKLSKEEAPNLLYLEYYRGGAYDDELITLDPDNPNYLDCDLDGVVLNPNGAIKYYNHYHSALYEDEKFDYFIPYQVKVLNKYTGIHRGPARKFPTLATIIETPILTITEERNGWGRLKEYPVGWILLSATEPVVGPGQNPDYDVPDAETATIPFASEVHITKLTVDRLWCYVPEVESWVKAEDISYNQSGKLYNALDIEVINLDNIDFNEVASLDDMGIYPNKRILQFHQMEDYKYEGDYTYDAFSQLHEIEFMYPETIYNYTCVYYKDNVFDGDDTTASNELGRASFTCSIGDWNPDWDTFIATSWKYDENENLLPPKLYRDSELTLTWDYFGFDKNLFKPEGYQDGIYLWNPRSWDKGDVKFGFSEIVRTGSQTVLYPGIPTNMYKIANSSTQISLPFKNAENANPSFSLNLKKNPEGSKLNNYYDVDIVFDPSTSASYNIGYSWTYKHSYGHASDSSSTAFSGMTYSSSNGIGVSLATQYGSGSKSVSSGMGTITSYRKDYVFDYNKRLSSLKYKEAGDYFSANYSNHREETTFVFGHGNFKTGLKPQYYLDDGTLIIDSTNITGHYGLSQFDKLYEEYGKKGTIQADGTITYYDSVYATSIQPVKIPTSTTGSAISVSFYQNFLMIHCWVPVPKGYWYKFNGEDLRIPENGWYDLMTGEFIAAANATIYLLDQTVGVDKKYDYFSNWNYNTSDVDYIIQLNQNTNSYQQPDLYAIKSRTLSSGLVLPISKYTSDAENRVVGEWYYSGDQWFESLNGSIYAGSFDKAKMTKLQKAITLVKPENTKTYYVYLDPSNVEYPGVDSSASYSNTSSQIITTYYNYVDENNYRYYFDGQYWIPETYTSLNVVESNKNYAVIPNTLNYYSQPIENDLYLEGTYRYGDRLTVLHTAAQDSEWGFTGLGWIKVNVNTLSEII